MKKQIITISICLLSLLAFSDYKITRGPEVGELFYVGPTHLGIGLYYSTDYGMTAVCVDSISNFGNICADITKGIIYYRDFIGNLYISENYGEYGSWQYRYPGIKQQINSGRIPGEIFSSFSKHSDDYAQSFITHSINGYFGYRKDITIDQLNQNIGYVLSYTVSIPDSVYLFISYDKFENLTVRKVFNFGGGETISLSRGSNTGEIFLFNHTRKELMLSNDYGANWRYINIFNIDIGNYFIITGGRYNGELYILYNYYAMSGLISHTYIYHSEDYGLTYEVHHPYSQGKTILLANFSAIAQTNTNNSVINQFKNEDRQSGSVPLTVQFCNYSIDEITKYEWDFNNDGIVDSNDENPTYIYPDTGYYSVKLTVYDQWDTNIFLRENYICAYQNINASETPATYKSDNEDIILCYPNPFNRFTSFMLHPDYAPEDNEAIEIFDLQGRIVQKLDLKSSLIWDGKDMSGLSVDPGIYLYRLSKQPNTIQKIILLY